MFSFRRSAMVAGRSSPMPGTIHLCESCRAGSPLITSPFCTVCGSSFPDRRAASTTAVVPVSATLPPMPRRAAPSCSKGGAGTDPSLQVWQQGSAQQAPGVAGRTALHGICSGVCGRCHHARSPPCTGLRQRGFNQAVLLGEILAKRWRLPLCRRNLQRTRWTEPQINLTAAERRQNVQGAFAVSEPAAVTGKRIILVDDVFTTGSTVAECAKVLKKAGATAVFVVTVARATG